jgi:hypothetical protein
MNKGEEITQYNQCSEDWRHYNNTIWQIPSVAVVISSAILAVAYQYVEELLPRTIILFFGGLILLSLTIALIKHRLFHNQRTEFLSNTEDDWVDSNKIKRIIKRKTEEIPNGLWFQKMIAYHWLLGVMIITMLCFFGLFFHNLFLLFGGNMDTINVTQAVDVVNSIDWKLIVAIIAAIAGWAAFLLKYQSNKRLYNQDWSKWEKNFVAYRREHLQPFAEILRKTYEKFIEGQHSVLQTWEEAVHAAKWPRNLPMPEGLPLREWRSLYGVGLDTEDEHLFKFAEAIYPVFNTLAKTPIQERSILQPEEFDTFHKARGGIADYFELCGNMMKQSRRFAQFLEQKVRPNHYYKVKLAAYLELALVRAFGEASETGSGKLGLFRLGHLWKTDDMRK